jgi:hypothetical protein
MENEANKVHVIPAKADEKEKEFVKASSTPQPAKVAPSTSKTTQTPPKAAAIPARAPNSPHPHSAPGHSETSGQAASHMQKIASQHKMEIHDLSNDPAQVYAFLLECSCGYQARSHSKEQAEADKVNHLAHKSFRASVR